MIREPSIVIIAGPSGSGKSELVEQWLRYLNVFQVKPKTVVYAYDRWQSRFDRMQKQHGIRFHRGLQDPSHFTKWFAPSVGVCWSWTILWKKGGRTTACWICSPKIPIIATSPCCTWPKIYSPLENSPRRLIAMPITLWPSKTHEIKRAYGPFYCKPFPTVGVKSCAHLNASPPSLFGYLMLDVHPASNDRYQLWSHLTPREGQAQVHTLPVDVPAVQKRAATRTRTSKTALRWRTTH